MTKDGHAVASEDETQCLVGGISEKFVRELMGEDIAADQTKGLCTSKMWQDGKTDGKK